MTVDCNSAEETHDWFDSNTIHHFRQYMYEHYTKDQATELYSKEHGEVQSTCHPRRQEEAV